MTRAADRLAHSWWLGSMAGFDLEATDKLPETSEIVSYCLAELDPGPRPVEIEHELAQPTVPINPDASDIHGHTEESLLAADAMPQGRAVERCDRFILDAVEAGVPIVGMNLSYDLTMMDRLRRKYLGGEGYKIGSILPVIDIRVIDLYIDPYRRGGRKLVDLCKHYGVAHHGAHDAQEDVLATCRVAWKIGRLTQATHHEIASWYNRRKENYHPRSYQGHTAWLTQMQRLKAVGKLRLTELHQAQVEWAWEQRAHLQQHLRKTDPAAKVDPRWPVIPLSPPGGTYEPSQDHAVRRLPPHATDGGDGDPNSGRAGAAAMHQPDPV